MNAHVRRLWIGGVVLAVGVMATPAWAEDPYELDWASQIGTSGDDVSRSVAVDGLGNAWISGYTDDSLGGSGAGSYDAFLSKFDAAGNHLWSQQLGTVTSDRSSSVTVDGLGNAYISGETSGSLGGPHAGGSDIFLSKFDSDGNELWSQQIGTTGRDESVGVAVDGLGNIYISGTTEGSLGGPGAGGFDAFLFKFDGDGNQLWSQQFGTSSFDWSYSVAVDSVGNSYVSGWTRGSLGGPNAGSADAFLSKFDTDGNHLWSQQIGTSDYDQSNSVAVDGLGNAYISGPTLGSLGAPNAGDWDAFLSKFDANGNHLWSQQIGTSGRDQSWSVAVDGLGHAYISGVTDGTLGGSGFGSYDAFLSKFDAAGSHLWSQRRGPSTYVFRQSVAVDGLGNAWISGYTGGSLGGPNAGGNDAFIAKFSAANPDGDANFDGTVNALDLSILGVNWLAAVGGGSADGDFNAAGTVNALDLSILGSNWLVGASDGGMSFNDAIATMPLGGIPEPASLGLLGAGCLFLMRRRR